MRKLLGSAVLMLHLLKDYATAARSNGPVLLRRSTRRVQTVALQSLLSKESQMIGEDNKKYLRGMKMLQDHLAVEKQAGRYFDEIGFVA